jgi:hypothetical protein
MLREEIIMIMQDDNLLNYTFKLVSTVEVFMSNKNCIN